MQRLVLVAFVLVAGCAGDGSTDPAVDGTRAAGEQRGLELFAALDAEITADDQAVGTIASVIAALDQLEIDHAQLALARTVDPDIADYASMLIVDHRASLERQEALLVELDAIALDSECARYVAGDGALAYQQLGFARDADFDHRYAMTQVELQAAALVLVRGAEALAPLNAYRDFLADADDALSAHLDLSTVLAQ